MNNPYDVLGVSQNATDEQIKEAYRQLARRLTDEQESGNAVKIDERMRELDRAYDEIIMSRSTNSGRDYNAPPQYEQQYQTAYTSSTASEFDDIRDKIRAGRLDDAEMLLDGYPDFNRNAEWHFLKGNIQYRKGWLEQASGNYATACSMNPDNREYRAAYDGLNNSSNGGYRTARGGNKDKSSCSACDMCSGLLCADCCCECMGGDLIRCC